ncbi:MAG: GNAT family N-acetyltransferase [Prevotellaceae bacterium]|jgi:RimJ/RimL family protein N-acetyltransferase|nr:GNAT family N-acetyltransferase [Prevotellaceae bacterium]
MYFKKLVGKKCYLSPIVSNDAEKFTEWLNDMELLLNLQLYNSVINIESEKIFLNNLSKEHNYSIIDLEKDELLGICGFLDIDYVNQTAETGIFIGNKNYYNKGYGTEALSLLIDYGFKALNFHNIMLKVYEYNKRAKKCYEKIGFQEIGTRREALCRNLKKHDIIYMDILSNEFYDKYKQ